MEALRTSSFLLSSQIGTLTINQVVERCVNRKTRCPNTHNVHKYKSYISRSKFQKLISNIFNYPLVSLILPVTSIGLFIGKFYSIIHRKTPIVSAPNRSTFAQNGVVMALEQLDTFQITTDLSFPTGQNIFIFTECLGWR